MNALDVTEKPDSAARGSLHGVVGQPRIYGIRICLGANPKWTTLPISNLPPQTIKVRRRIRNDSAAVAYVKTETEVQRWILAPDGEAAVKLEILQGINSRQPNADLSHTSRQ